MLKGLRVLILIVLMAGLLVGCKSSENGISQDNKTPNATESKSKADAQKLDPDANKEQDVSGHTEADEKTVTTDTKEPDKASSVPGKDYGTDNGSYNPVNISLLTEADLSNIMKRLVDLGYLTAKTKSEAEFIAAVKAFQKDQGINVSGELTAETLKCLNNVDKNK